jgi:hypothetical protein
MPRPGRAPHVRHGLCLVCDRRCCARVTAARWIVL